jgi:hypothetical protein
VKLLAGLGFVVAVALTFIYMSSKSSTGDADTQHKEWKRTAVEPETATRPSTYEAMKWSPDDVENRKPASNRHK